MKKEIVRLAFLQVTLVIYSVLGVGVLLRVFHGSPAPDIFARYVRDWGFWFLIVTAGWSAWAILEMRKPEADHRAGISVLLSGVVLAGVIAVVAVLATISIASYHSLLIPTSHPAKPPIINRKLPDDS